MRHVSSLGCRPNVPPDDPELLARGVDSLTGLLSHDTFLEVVRRRTAESLAPGMPFALLALGFDGLADAADGLRRAIAARLRRDIRAGDLAARMGADGFAILLPGAGAEADARGLAARLVDVMDRPFLLDGHAVTTRCRIGIAVFPTDAWEPERLLACAEAALRNASAEGRARFALPQRGPQRGGWQRHIA